jgi:alanine dehydrogenase
VTAKTGEGTLVLTASDVRATLDLASCIEAVEAAFRRLHANDVIPPAVLGSHVPGGGFHVKAAGMRGERFYYAVKINANFPANPVVRGLPTIQGVVALFDAESGEVLALMDSTEITALRTAAASAVAARHLAPPDAHRLTVVGCGIQGRYHARAMLRVRAISHVRLADRDRAAAERLARQLTEEFTLQVEVVDDHRAAARDSDIVVTSTPAREPVLDAGDLPAGGFIAAIGADSEAKQEITAAAMARCAVVVDILDQCAAIGDLHHAIAAGAMTRDDVRADLAAVVSGLARDRFGTGDTVLFDSTGTALEDVAAAAMVYERARSGDRAVTRLRD